MVVCLVVAAMPCLAAGVTATLPLDRANYVRGEQVPITLLPGDAAATPTLSLRGTDGKTIAIWKGDVKSPTDLWLDSAKLAPGAYTLLVDGAETACTFRLVSPLRRSPGIQTDEGSMDKAKIDPESGVSGVFHCSADDGLTGEIFDQRLALGAMSWRNESTRPTSFVPVRDAYQVEFDRYRRRLQVVAQQCARFPAFGGTWFDWDPTGMAAGNMLYTYWQWGDQTETLRKYVKVRVDALGEDFTRRTGLKPVSREEYDRYMTYTGKRSDLPTISSAGQDALFKKGQEGNKLSPEERADIQKRLRAWTLYITNRFHDTYVGYTAALRPIDPTLTYSTSINLDHAPVYEGQYAPSAYEPLDFGYMSAWNDQVSWPDYPYQAAFSAAMIRANSPDKPIWISTSSGIGAGGMPGELLRCLGHVAGMGGQGIGTAFEGFSSLFGGMSGTAWEKIKGTPKADEILGVRDWLARFGSVFANSRPDSRVGILFSRTQTVEKRANINYGSAPWTMLYTMSRAGRTPSIVTEEMIAKGRLADYKALILMAHTVELPQEVNDALAAFVRGGGKLIADENTTVQLSGMTIAHVKFPYIFRGKPFNGGEANVTGPTSQDADVRYQTYCKPLVEALGTTGQGVLSAELDSWTTLHQLDGGQDVKYILAVNDSWNTRHTDWQGVKTTLKPTAAMSADAVVFDLTDEKQTERDPVPCDLTATTARIYAITARPAQMNVSATQSVAVGQDLGVRVGFTDPAGRPLQGVLPFQIKLTDGANTVAFDLYRATDNKGQFAWRWTVPFNAPAGQWTLVVHSQLNGQEISLPVTIPAAESPTLASAGSDPAIIRTPAPIAALLRDAKREIVIPVFPEQADLLPQAEKLVASIKALGGNARVWQNPVMITYIAGYDPDVTNERVVRGEAVGKRQVKYINGNQWDSQITGYAYGKDVLVLGIVKTVAVEPKTRNAKPTSKLETGNVLLNAALEAKLLWPAVPLGGNYPGPGRGIVQYLWSPFLYGADAIVLTATDSAGLESAISALTKIDPAQPDRFADSVQNARRELLAQWGLPRSTPQADLQGLTLSASDAKNAQNSQHLVFLRSGQWPLPKTTTESPHPPYQAVLATAKIPGFTSVVPFKTFCKDEDGFYEAANPGDESHWKTWLTWYYEMRIKLDAPESRKYRLAFQATPQLPKDQRTKFGEMVIIIDDGPELHAAPGEGWFTTQIETNPGERKIEIVPLNGASAEGTIRLITAGKPEQVVEAAPADGKWTAKVNVVSGYKTNWLRIESPSFPLASADALAPYAEQRLKLNIDNKEAAQIAPTIKMYVVNPELSKGEHVLKVRAGSVPGAIFRGMMVE